MKQGNYRSKEKIVDYIFCAVIASLVYPHIKYL